MFLYNIVNMGVVTNLGKIIRYRNGTTALTAAGKNATDAAPTTTVSDSSISTIGENSNTHKEKFSMEKPVEETDKLVALHNLTEKNLRDTLELGGLPMPSIAIVQAQAGYAKYGRISIVFSKSTIDPHAERDKACVGGGAGAQTSRRGSSPRTP
jgi:hypothetical protein